MTEEPIQTASRRPLGVLVVATVQFVRAILLILQAAGLDPTASIGIYHISDQIPEGTPGSLEFYITRAVVILLVVASLAFGAGLLAGRRWGWVGAIVISGISLAFSIGGWWSGHPTYLSMFINVIAVFYLNQRDVRAIYGELLPDEDLEP